MPFFHIVIFIMVIYDKMDIDKWGIVLYNGNIKGVFITQGESSEYNIERAIGGKYEKEMVISIGIGYVL